MSTQRDGDSGVRVVPATRQVFTGNLPPELTSFVGRGREVGEVKGLLSESRLVTLIGVGGAGKTRLALRVAADLGRAFEDGVWFVDLTQLQDQGSLSLELHDPDVLAYLVGATLGLRDLGGAPLQRLVAQLADQRMLLVLDNCEHLLPASAVLAHALLAGCPELRILATSRDALGIGGETVFGVPPLPSPDPQERPSLAEIGRSDAVVLFLSRAQAASSDFQLTADNHVAVGELCHRLDGLPLAIELAAARVRVLAPQQILDRLTDRFALLSRGNRAAPARQQTLRACVDWSFDLCSKPEQRLWARLSVFAGTFELDAVEGVCADEDLPEVDMLELVASLVDKSVVVRNDRDDVNDPHHLVRSARYRMLETIRDYGQEKLIEADEQATLRRGHRDWYQQLVARARAEWVSDRQAYWLARLGREHPNLRAAMEYSLTEPGQAEAALRVAVSVPMHYWWVRGLFGEGRRWIDRALAQAAAPTDVHARALLVNSQLAFAQGDADTGMRLLDEGEALARRLDASAELGHADYIRGLGALLAGDLPVAVEALERSRNALATEPDPDLDLYMNVLITFGIAAGLAGDHERANACRQEMLTIVESHKGGFHRMVALWAGGIITYLQGDLGEAAAQEMENLRLARAWVEENPYHIAFSLETLAWITADQQRHRRAATLLGAADHFFADSGSSIAAHRHFVGHHAACERQTRDALGEAAFADAFRHGHALTYDDAIAYAFDESRQPAPSPS